MYQAWKDPKDGMVMLLENLGLDEQGALSVAGFEKLLEIDTGDLDIATQRFINAVHQQQPDVKVEKISFSKLRSKLPRARSTRK